MRKCIHLIYSKGLWNSIFLVFQWSDPIFVASLTILRWNFALGGCNSGPFTPLGKSIVSNIDIIFYLFFSRNHNYHTGNQDPAFWPEVAETSRRYLLLRYRYLPYLYTLMYKVLVRIFFLNFLVNSFYRLIFMGTPLQDLCSMRFPPT